MAPRRVEGLHTPVKVDRASFPIKLGPGMALRGCYCGSRFAGAEADKNLREHIAGAKVAVDG